jgi:hypothetical protein
MSAGRTPSTGKKARSSEAMTKRMIDRNGRRVVLGAAIFAALAALTTADVALPQNADCARLRQAISDASRDDQGSQYEAAAQRQQAEIDRTVAYAHSIGCDHRQFLFFGSAPPAQCGQINAQIGRMRANLDELQSRAGAGASSRRDLIARYDAQCLNAAPAQSPNIFANLFGGGPSRPGDVQIVPLNPDATPGGAGEAQAGSKAVCVRSCDGAFFPISYSANGDRMQSLADMCHALCPNADVALYTYPAAGDIEQAVSIDGARYVDSPTALKFRQSFDPTCSCRRRGQSWAEALAPAEAKLGPESKGDIFVTPEKAAEMSRPRPEAKTPDPKTKAAKGTLDAPNPPKPDLDVDPALSQQAATISREASGIASGDAQTGARYGEGQGQTVEVVGSDGVKRRVRIIDPTL